MRLITLKLATVLSCVLSSACIASTLGGSPWKELSFTTEDGNHVKIEVDNRKNLLRKVSVKNDACEGELSKVESPGIIDLNGVEFLIDKDDVGQFNILIIPFLRDDGSDGRGTLAMTIRKCALVSTEVY